MQSWAQLVHLCGLQVPGVDPGIFYNALTALAEPDFAKHVLCIDGEVSLTTVADDANYELPLGFVLVKVVAFKGVPLDPIHLSNLKARERYQADGTTLRTGTPWGYYIENDQLTLVPAPSSASNLRINFYTLPTYDTKRYKALTDTTATILYLNLAVGQELADDSVVVTNITRSSLTGAISAYALTDDLRHKYTVASIASQAVGDEIQIPIYKYVPMIPEVYAPLLIPFGVAHGFAVIGDTKQFAFYMAEYERLREGAAIKRAGRAFPEKASFDQALVIG